MTDLSIETTFPHLETGTSRYDPAYILSTRTFKTRSSSRDAFNSRCRWAQSTRDGGSRSIRTFLFSTDRLHASAINTYQHMLPTVTDVWEVLSSSRRFCPN
eukprot:5900631-Prymnesium_polylepis.1